MSEVTGKDRLLVINALESTRIYIVTGQVSEYLYNNEISNNTLPRTKNAAGIFRNGPITHLSALFGILTCPSGMLATRVGGSIPKKGGHRSGSQPKGEETLHTKSRHPHLGQITRNPVAHFIGSVLD